MSIDAPLPNQEDMEKAVRAFLRRQARRFGKMLLKPEFHRMMEGIIRQQIAMMQLLKKEAKRKKPSKMYSNERGWLALLMCSALFNY
jgi:hypothetical protein